MDSTGGNGTLPTLTAESLYREAPVCVSED